jgi:microcin C transport system substrate-binding protein
MKLPRFAILFTAATITLGLTACGQKATAPAGSSAATGYVVPAKPRGPNNPLALAEYKAHPEFYVFKTPADFAKETEGLKWEDGSALPIFSDSAARRGGTQYAAIESFPPTLRTVGPDSNSSFRTYLLDDNEVVLVQRHPNASGYYPGLASSWAVSADKQTVYFKLDPDARWSDGVPVEADDFMFMFFFYRSPFLQAPWYANWYTEEYKSITKYDAHTLAITLREPKPDPVERAGLRAIPEHFYGEFGADFPTRYQWRVEPTTGPYTVAREADVEKDRAVTLTRIANWWANDKKFFAHRFNPSRVVFQLVRSRDKAFEMFKLGELDTFNLLLPPRFWYDQMNLPEVEKGYISKTLFYTYQPEAPSGLFINSSKPLLDNRDIRQGIAFACNWDKVIQVVMRGDARRLHPWADSHAPFEHPTLRARPYDVTKALAAFARAGFTTRGPDGILRNTEGKRLSFVLTFGSEAYVDIPPILKEEAAKAGLELQIEKLDATAAFQKGLQKNHEIMLSGWSGGAEFAPRFHEFFFGEDAVKPQTNNFTATNLPALDALILRYDRSRDKDEMVDLSHQMIQMIFDDSAYIPGFVQSYIRWGAWRWVKFPSWLNVREAQYAGQYGVHWIDEDVKQETLAARKEGKSFGRSDFTDTKWKQD